MTYLYALHTDAVDPDNEELRARISRPRLAMIDRRRGPARAQGFAASLLLEYAVAQHYPDFVHPLSIAVSSDGKPYFPAESNVHFSLSHSGAWAVCALGDRPVGVDIEQRTPGRRDIATRFFHPDEVKYINSLRENARDDAFYSLWVLKESFIKATGRGLMLPLRSFCVSLEGEPHLKSGAAQQPYTLSLIPFEDIAYRLALCVQQDHPEKPEFKIFTKL